MKKLLIAFCLIFLVSGHSRVFGQIPFIVNGIKYNFCNALYTGERGLEVLPGDIKYSGNVVIPAYITLADKTYPVIKLAANAFAYCDELTSVSLPETLTQLEEYAFTYCPSITYIKIPDSVIQMGYGDFSYCDNLKKVTLPSGCNLIPGCFFSHSERLSDIHIPWGYETLRLSVFSNCYSLENIEIPSSVNSIGPECFNNCKSLKKVVLGISKSGKMEPASGTLLFDGISRIFKNCENLKEIYSLYLEPPYKKDSADQPFSDYVYENAVLYIPESALEDYQNSPIWSKFLNIRTMEFNDGVESVFMETDRENPVYIDTKGVINSSPVPGINIMVSPDGSTKKIIN